MDCPHLNERVLFDATTAPSEGTNGKPPSQWTCTDCAAQENPWLCMICGEVRCGRFVNADGLKHFEANEDHCVCLDCTSYAVFCYKCDEFVVNDTKLKHLDSMRKHLQQQEGQEDEMLSQSSSSNHCQLLEQDSCREGSTDAQKITSLKLHQRHGDQDQENVSERPDLRPDLRTSAQDQENVLEGRDLRRRRSSETCDKQNKKLKTGDDAGASHSKKKPRTSGLRNLGNTCFMNAVLQSLSNIQYFSGYIKQLPVLESSLTNNSNNKRKVQTRKTRDSEEDIFLVEELRKTLIALWQGSKTAISPESLFSVIWKVVPRFRGYQQQDAHEFMRYLLDRLHSELLQLLPYPNNNSPFIGPKGKSTIVTAIFGGILQSEVKCLVCSVESKKHDPFLDLSLDIPVHFTAKSHKPKDGETTASLSDCLASFTDIEELEDSELYMCTNCKRRQRSTKKFWIRRLPNVLCLHLKRFRWNVYFRQKVEAYVDFPIRGLEMSGFTLNNLHETRGCGSAGTNIYDLAAVIVHHGSGAGSGHYTAYAIHDNVWYHFNDSSVTVSEEETVKKCKAYILFYIRREVKLPDHLKL